VAQSPAKTLTIDVSCFWLHLLLTLTHLSPYLLPAGSPCLPRGRTNLEREYLCGFVPVPVSLTLRWVGADARVNNPWAGMKMRKVFVGQ